MNNHMGPSAGRSNTTGCYNNFFGAYAGYDNTTGCNGNFFGYYAGRVNTTGTCNNFFGRAAGRCNTTGNNNNFFGESAGLTNTTGSNNISIGARNLFTGGREVSNYQVILDSGSGNAACFAGSFSSWGNTSDCRDKTNISNLSQGKDFLAQLRPVKFEWDFRTEVKKNTPTQGTEEAGFLAQEVQEVVANNNAEYLNLVDESCPEELGLYKANFVPVLVKAVQELTAENQELRAEIAAIKAHVGMSTT